MGQSGESGRKKLALQHLENEKLKEDALPLLDEQMPKNVLDAVSLVLEGLSQWEQELRTSRSQKPEDGKRNSEVRSQNEKRTS